jgi:hypothetical protein
MKKSFLLLLVIFLSISLITGCGGSANNSQILSPEATRDNNKSSPSASQKNLTATEARAVLQAWVDSHPFQFVSELESGSYEHIFGGKEYYLFHLGIIRLGIVEILVQKETGELFHLSSPDNPIFEPLDDWYEKERATYLEYAFLTREEARRNLQIWIDDHPIQPPVILAVEYDEYTEGNDEYYLFSLDEIERYWMNFLVHKETSEMFFMMISDGEESYIEITPLDDWYQKYY